MHKPLLALFMVLGLALPTSAAGAAKSVKVKLPQPGEVSVAAWAVEPGKRGKKPKLAVKNAKSLPEGITVVGGVGKHKRMKGKYAAFVAVVNRSTGAANAAQLDALILIGAHRARRGELINAAHVVQTTATGFRALATACKRNNLFHYAYKYASPRALAGKVFLPSRAIASAAASESCDRIYGQQQTFRQSIGFKGSPTPSPSPSPTPTPTPTPTPAPTPQSCSGNLAPADPLTVTVSFTCTKASNDFKIQFGAPPSENEPARTSTLSTRITEAHFDAFQCFIEVMALFCTGVISPGQAYVGTVKFDDIYNETLEGRHWNEGMKTNLRF